MTDTMQRLVDLTRQLDELDKSIRAENEAMLVHPDTPTKRFPMFESVSFVIPMNENGTPTTQGFVPKEQYWNNGAWDAYITEVTHTSYALVNASGTDQYRRLYDSEQGLYMYSDAPPTGLVFDFEWNFRLPTSGRVYANGNARYLSRKSFGNKYTDEMLRFTDPLFIKAGDFMVWMLRPTLFNPGWYNQAPPGQYDAIRAIVVNFNINGYRDGTMAEAAYEQP